MQRSFLFPWEGRAWRFFYAVDNMSPGKALSHREWTGDVRQVGFLILLLLLVGCVPGNDAELDMPPLADADYYWIASRIFDNETNGKLQYLAHWNNGEDFPSLGIGHFIWFPAGVDAPFDESFPTMLADVRRRADQCAPAPGWLAGPDVSDAPWADKASFDAADDDPRLVELRAWLARTAPQQAQYIVASFNARWNALQLEDGDKDELTRLLRRLLSTSQGLFAVVDYYNFKGLGSNPRERYAGEGWGLVQVLRDIVAPARAGDADLVTLFSEATANRLALRVVNAPPERNEGRWLEGWHRRVAAYKSVAPPLAGTPASAFRVKPYLQAVEAGDAVIAWYSHGPDAGSVRVVDGAGLTVEPAPVRRACELAYHLLEFGDLEEALPLPYRQEVTLTGLQAGATYRIEVSQDGEVAELRLRTPTAGQLHFVVYADSETEPESTGTKVWWPAPDGGERHYLVDQASGYAANLAAIVDKDPDFVAIAGDLVESGGEQRDWDEFWRHNATLAAAVPIVPAAGNHDYFGGPGEFGGFGPSGTTRALAKYHSYFGRPPFYVVDSGPVALLVLDLNNGLPERSDTDTNWYLDGTAPPWQADSEQRRWLEATLATAQREKAFTFVMFHVAPYTSGVHGKPPGTTAGRNFSSGLPLQALTPLFLEYGVDAIFSGHDEMYEHSAVAGYEQLSNGERAAHTVHFFTVGIGGDGLRGPDPLADNPARLFLAHDDAPETWNTDGDLQDGGKHYGHLDVRVSRGEDGRWRAVLNPVYLLPQMNAAGEVQSFALRSYDDRTVLESARVD